MFVSRQQSKRGEIAYDLDSDLLVCIVQDDGRRADKVYVNPEDGLTVDDLYQECEADDRVYGVVYLEELDYDDFSMTQDEVLKMNQGQRFGYLFHSDTDIISVPEGQLKFRH